MEKQMFIYLKGTFSLINERKDDKHAFWELMYKFCINYKYYKESTKFSEFNSFH